MERFENKVCTLKTHQTFSIHTCARDTAITSHLCFFRKIQAGSVLIIVMWWFLKSSIFKILRVFSTSSVPATNRPLVWMEHQCVKSKTYCFNKSRGQKQFNEPLKISCSCMCERVMLVFFFSLPIGWQSCKSLFQSCLFQSFFNTWVKIAVLFTLAVCEGAILVDVELKLFERLKVIKMALLDFFFFNCLGSITSYFQKRTTRDVTLLFCVWLNKREFKVVHPFLYSR